MVSAPRRRFQRLEQPWRMPNMSQILGASCTHRVLRQEPVTGGDHCRLAFDSYVDDRLDIQICPRIQSIPYGIRLVGLSDMWSVCINSSVDCDRRNVKFPSSPDDPQSDLTTIRDENLWRRHIGVRWGVEVLTRRCYELLCVQWGHRPSIMYESCPPVVA